MDLVVFQERFVRAFKDYIETEANGNLSRLINLQKVYINMAIGFYDNAIIHGRKIDNEYLESCIESEKERVERV